MKMNGKHKWLFLLLVFAGTSAFGQIPRKYIRTGNKQYEAGNFSEAEVKYRKAVEKNSTYYKGQFNLGDALYEQKNMEESGKIFNNLSETEKNPRVKSSAFYNYGNTLMAQKKYKEAMEAYKKSLLLDPNNANAKYNYEYARKKMIQQQKQKKKDKNNKNKNKDKQKQKQDKNKDKQNKDKQNKDKNKQDKNKDKKNQQQKPQDKKDKQQKNQQDKNEQGKKGDQKKKQQQMSKKDAQRMLNALKNDEKKTLQKLQKKKARASRAKKSDIDW